MEEKVPRERAGGIEQTACEQAVENPHLYPFKRL